MQTKIKGQVFAAGEGTRVLSAMGTEMAFKVTAEETAGRYSFLEYRVPPRFGGPPLHIHAQTDEGYFMLEGALQITLGGETITAGPGTFVFIPRGTPHTFANPSADAARLLVILSPSGFEQYFVELFGMLAEDADRPGYLEKMRAIAAKYDQVLVGAPGEH